MTRKYIVSMYDDGAMDYRDWFHRTDPEGRMLVEAIRGPLYEKYNNINPDSRGPNAEYRELEPINEKGLGTIKLGTSGEIPFYSELFNGLDSQNGQRFLSLAVSVGAMIEPVTFSKNNEPSGELPDNLGAHNVQIERMKQAAGKPTNGGFFGRLSAAIAAKYNKSFEQTRFSNIYIGSPNSASQRIDGGPTVGVSIDGNTISPAGLYGSEVTRQAATELYTQSYHIYGNNLGIDSSVRYKRNFVDSQSKLQSILLADVSAPDEKNVYEPDILSIAREIYPGVSYDFCQQINTILKIISRNQENTFNDLFKQDQIIFTLRPIGWNNDTHSGQAEMVPHAQRSYNAVMYAFWQELDRLKINDILIFQSSEFGRTLSPNEFGTDHGRSGHAMCFGRFRGFNAGMIFGQPEYPTLTVGGLEPRNSSPRGRYEPEYDWQQVYANAGIFMGLSEEEMINTQNIFGVGIVMEHNEKLPNYANTDSKIIPIVNKDVGEI